MPYARLMARVPVFRSGGSHHFGIAVYFLQNIQKVQSNSESSFQKIDGLSKANTLFSFANIKIMKKGFPFRFSC